MRLILMKVIYIYQPIHNFKDHKHKNKMKQKLSIFCLASFISFLSFSQDTFSIVAVDSITGEVGSAGASCVDLTSFPGLEDHFLGELFPGKGAINTQAWYTEGNQINARNRMNAGDTPDQIIDWLVNNDISNQPQLRQYGIASLVNGSPESAGHTGTSTDDYKNHITGPNYSIQGNILLGQEVLDSMESMFLNAEGDLACKLMAAMQGANMVGADSRCAPNGTSSLFAFIKVATPDDSFGNPSFVQSVRTANGDGIEPIDSLQILFDQAKNCIILNTEETESFDDLFLVYPNPFMNKIQIENKGQSISKIEIIDPNGKLIHKSTVENYQEVNTSHFPTGVYFIKISDGVRSFVKRAIKQ